jgi:hypothetical protein
MKNTFEIKPLTLLILAFLSLTFTACLDDDCTERRVFVEFEPIYVQPEEFRVDISFVENRALQNTGKIYFYNNLILINELYEGVHIIDNADPANPQKLGFIHIPGNLDVAIKDGNLYADNYVDLLTIDINDIKNPQIICRDEEVFGLYNYVQSLGYYVRMRATERSMTIDCSDPNFGDNNFNRGGVVFWADDALQNGAPINTTTSGSTIGIGGSLARFTLSKDYLYVINELQLISYDVSMANKPVKSTVTSVNWGIETLFPYKDYLFIGANTGVFIYEITDPANPTYVSEFRHANSCDPVFVKDDIAYVTLRDGNFCQNFTNQLDILDVKNIRSPQLIATHPMQHPHGLSVTDKYLYLCEGEYGLKVFEVEDLENIPDNKIAHVKTIDAKDVISLSDAHILVIGDDGLHQYDTSNPNDIKEISYLEVQ